MNRLRTHFKVPADITRDEDDFEDLDAFFHSSGDESEEEEAEASQIHQVTSTPANTSTKLSFSALKGSPINASVEKMRLSNSGKKKFGMLAQMPLTWDDDASNPDGTWQGSGKTKTGGKPKESPQRKKSGKKNNKGKKKKGKSGKKNKGAAREEQEDTGFPVKNLSFEFARGGKESGSGESQEGDVSNMSLVSDSSFLLYAEDDQDEFSDDEEAAQKRRKQEQVLERKKRERETDRDWQDVEDDDEDDDDEDEEDQFTFNDGQSELADLGYGKGSSKSSSSASGSSATPSRTRLGLMETEKLVDFKTSLEGQVEYKGSGRVRRSKRRKIKPLQYWKNEHVVYVREEGDAVPKLIHKYAKPATVKKSKSTVSHVNESLAEAQEAEKSMKVRRRKARSAMARWENDYDVSDLDYKEEFETKTGRYQLVGMNHPKKLLKQATSRQKHVITEYRHLEDSSYDTGTMTIVPGGSKANSIAREELIFFVASGQAHVRVHGYNFVVGKGMSFRVLVDHSYSIENTEEFIPLVMFYVKVRFDVGDDDEDEDEEE